MNQVRVREVSEALVEYQRVSEKLADALKMAAQEVVGYNAPSVVRRPVSTPMHGVWTNDGKPGRPHLQIGGFVSHRVRQGKKVCTKCQLIKSASMFGPRHAPNGGSRLQSWCRWCQARNARLRARA